MTITQIIFTMSLFASSPGVPTLTLIGIGNPQVFALSLFCEIEDLVASLGNFYFSSAHKGIVKRTPKK